VESAFLQWTISIAPGELIVGRPGHRGAEWAAENPERQAEIDRANAAARYGHCGVGQDSHMAIDYYRVLELGTSGIRAMIDEKAAALDMMDPESVKKADFYEACRIVLRAVEKLADRYADLVEGLAGHEEDEKQAAEYRQIAENCRRVPKYPARTFYEAVQCVCFISYALSVKPLRPSMLQFQLGHPDRYLYPYYKKDRDAGILTDEFAQTLIDCMAIQINRRVPNGLSCGYMVGGRYADGTVGSNELTKMCMRAVEQVRLVYPSVGLCHTSDTPKEDLELALRILAKGHSHPAIFNDDVIQAGLRHYGLPADESCEYIHSTCVEITPASSSNVWVASPYMNLPGEMLAILPDECGSMEDLVEKYLAHIKKRIGENCRNEVLNRWERAKYCVDPLLSCFVKDCIETGVDIEEGGARYNWIMPSFVGVANAADALYTIDQLIFKRKELTFAELKAAMADNYQSAPELLAKIRALPKYGNDCQDADAPDVYVKRISEFIADTCEEFRVPFTGGRLIPSLFCWIMHDHFGQQTGATPDGRLAGFPLGDGSGPCQGREACGPTASILSSTKWSHKEFIGGVAVNLKFSKKMFREQSREVLLGLIRTYLARGGFELQINVVDHETLQKARENPENYRDLVVRIGGYSDYFVRLSPNMQAEVIYRTEHIL
jgi:formate C-acetyltransferase